MQSILGTVTAAKKLHLTFMAVMLAVALSGCSQTANQDEVSVSNDAMSAPLPDVLVALAVDETNLVVEVIVDGGTPQACTNLSVVAGTFSCNVTIPAGAHTLTLVYSIIDATYGIVQVATSSGIAVDIVAGETTSADFSTATLTYDDGDGDGVRNIDELDAGTDPSDDSCILDHSLVGSCTLG
jgi:hypothetical protein